MSLSMVSIDSQARAGLSNELQQNSMVLHVTANPEQLEIDVVGGPGTTPEPLGSDSIEILARALLITMCRRRIDPTRLTFAGGRDSGGKSHVLEAILTTDGTEASRSVRGVAVKMLQPAALVDKARFLKAFVNELRILNMLSHPNVVQVIGFVENIGNGIAWIVFPWENHGNLRQFLRSGEWHIPERVSLIKDVAAGLKYIHSLDPPICHGDIKSLNVLITSCYQAVITDFGSARIMRQMTRSEASMLWQTATPINERIMGIEEPIEIELIASGAQLVLTLSGPAGSLRWTAPEVFHGQPPNLASDIWALGWVGWEVITGDLPFPKTTSKERITLRVVAGQLPSLSDDERMSQILQLCSLMVECWTPNPLERPSAARCLTQLGWIPSVVPTGNEVDGSKVRSATLLCKKGEIHCLESRYDEALATLEEGLKVARSSGERPMIARTLLQLGHLHQVWSRLDEATSLITEALEIYTIIGDDSGRANALCCFGQIYQAHSSFIDAEDTFALALGVYTCIGNDRGRAHALRGLGRVCQARSQLDEASIMISQALTIYTVIADNQGRANALHGIGEIHQARYNYSDAQECFDEALYIYRSMGNKLGQANTIQRLGEIHQARWNLDEAKKSFAKALDLYTSTGNRCGQASALYGLGQIQQGRGKFDDASNYFEAALDISTGIGDALGSATATYGLGEIQQARGLFSQAKKLFVKALVIQTEIGYTWGQAASFVGLADIHCAMPRPSYADAESYYIEALAVAVGSGNYHVLASALVGLGDIQRAHSKYLEAEELYSKAFLIYTNIGEDMGRANVLLELGQSLILQRRYKGAKVLLTRAAKISYRLSCEALQDRSKELLTEALEAEALSICLPASSSAVTARGLDEVADLALPLIPYLGQSGLP